MYPLWLSVFILYSYAPNHSARGIWPFITRHAVREGSAGKLSFYKTVPRISIQCYNKSKCEGKLVV